MRKFFLACFLASMTVLALAAPASANSDQGNLFDTAPTPSSAVGTYDGWNPTNIALSVAGAGISVMTAANAVTTAATATGVTFEAVGTAMVVAGTSTTGVFLIVAAGAGVIYMVGSGELASIMKSADNLALRFQGK